MEENGAGRIGRKQNFTRVLLLFWPFSFSFFSFPPFAFGESKTAPVRAAEKVMDRAFNVGSHGIWDVGDRCVAPIGSHRPPPRRANGRRGRTRERESGKRGNVEGLSRTAGERNHYDNYACGAYNTVHAREETLELEVLSSIGDTANLLVVAR